jgi:hypothetical protein
MQLDFRQTFHESAIGHAYYYVVRFEKALTGGNEDGKG